MASAITDLILVCEYTTNGGPWEDDYYFVFGAGRPPRFYQVPLSMVSPILSILSARLGYILLPALIQSTDWKSGVLWPAALAGHELFLRSAQPRPRGVLNGLKDRFAPM